MSAKPNAAHEAASPISEGQMLAYAEVMTLLKISKRTIRRRVAEGRYIAYGNNTGKRILYQSILADIERNSTGGH
jgi:hypothetical protein